jgi:hypothetical protein
VATLFVPCFAGFLYGRIKELEGSYETAHLSNVFVGIAGIYCYQHFVRFLFASFVLDGQTAV